MQITMSKEYCLHDMDCTFLLKNEMSVFKALILFLHLFIECLMTFGYVMTDCYNFRRQAITH